MRLIFLYLSVVLFPACFFFLPSGDTPAKPAGSEKGYRQTERIHALFRPETGQTAPPGCEQIYREMHLDGIVNYTAFEQMMAGYRVVDPAEKDIVTLIDFSEPSTRERLFVFDLKQRKLLFSSLVSHGKNSGGNYATSFSNRNGSHKSSLGFYRTGRTYQGRNGYSLILDGLEKGINDRARERAIVMHGAAYADPSVVASAGRLGRSLGCPALPPTASKPIIDKIKNGTLLFIYADDTGYRSRSRILASSERLAPA